MLIQFIKQLFCGHDWSPNLATHNSWDGKRRIKRHFYYCRKCGKRKFVD